MNEPLRSRKYNRLQHYDYNQDGAYFITICTKDRKKNLSSIVGDDAHIVLKYYGITAEKYIRNVPEIEKYVIMPDHIHIIVRLENGSMWASTPTGKLEKTNHVANIIRSLKTLVSKELGESIFQRSYYDHVIRNQQDYNEIWQYIENNPRKWILQKRGECL